MKRLLLILIAVFTVSCGGGASKPLVTPNGPAADCSAEQTQKELQCVRDNPTRAGADKCIADLPKRDCTKLAPDGGV